MKLRIQGNAIRLRLNRREVEEFARTGRASAALQFGGGAVLRYSLSFGTGEDLRATFDGADLIVEVPALTARSWAESDTVGLQGQEALEDGGQLEIVIEKDFQCMHKGEGAMDPDAYPNPMIESA